MGGFIKHDLPRILLLNKLDQSIELWLILRQQLNLSFWRGLFFEQNISVCKAVESPELIVLLLTEKRLMPEQSVWTKFL